MRIVREGIVRLLSLLEELVRVFHRNVEVILVDHGEWHLSREVPVMGRRTLAEVRVSVHQQVLRKLLILLLVHRASALKLSLLDPKARPEHQSRLPQLRAADIS